LPGVQQTQQVWLDGTGALLVYGVSSPQADVPEEGDKILLLV